MKAKTNKKNDKIVFVTVGTGKFERLIRAIDNAVALGLIKNKVVAQIGRGDYKPQNIEYFDFKPSLEPYYKKCFVVVSHGGAGTTYEILEKGIPLVSAANLDRSDTHQNQLLHAMSKRKHLVWCKDLSKIHECIIKSKTIKFKKYESPSCDIANYLVKFISNFN